MLKSLKARRLRKLVKRALADDVLTDDEYDEIERYRSEADLSPTIVNEVRQKHAYQLLRPVIKQIERKRRLSPEHEGEIRRRLELVGAVSTLDPQMMMYKKLWELENCGEIHPEAITVGGILLKDGERCFHRVHATWARKKTVTETHGYRSSGVSVRVAKGISFRFGETRPIRTKYDAITDMDQGDLYVTDKRLVFVGDNKTNTITFGRVVSYEIFRDAFVVFKTSGPVEYFRVPQADAEYMGALVSTVA